MRHGCAGAILLAAALLALFASPVHGSAPPTTSLSFNPVENTPLTYVIEGISRENEAGDCLSQISWVTPSTTAFTLLSFDFDTQTFPDCSAPGKVTEFSSSPTIAFNAPGFYTFELTATDGEGLSSSASIEIDTQAGGLGTSGAITQQEVDAGAEAEVLKVGDVDGDLAVNQRDLDALESIVSGDLQTPANGVTCHLDATQDGIVDAVDVLRVRRLVTGEEQTLGACDAATGEYVGEEFLRGEERACVSSLTCELGDGCFEGVCRHAALALNPAGSQVIFFEEQASQTVELTWTLTNVGPDTALIADLEFIGCEGDVSCELAQLVCGEEESAQLLGLLPEMAGYTRLQADEQNPSYTESTGPTWKYEQVDHGDGALGSYSDIALGQTSVPHISYYAPAEKMVKYATRSQGTWQVENVGRAEFPATGGGTSIAVDALGGVHIAYPDAANKALYYAAKRSGGWSASAVRQEPTAQDVGLYPSISADLQGGVWISYVYNDCLAGRCLSQVMSAFNPGTGWSNEAVKIQEGGGGIGGTSLAVDKDGTAYIAFQSGPPNSHALELATFGNTGWSVELIDGSGDTGYHPNLVYEPPLDEDFDSSFAGTLHVAYQSLQGEQGIVRYASNATGSWQPTTVTQGPGVGAFPYVGVNAEGRAHLLFFDAEKLQSVYAQPRDGEGWELFEAAVPALLNEGMHSMAVDSTGVARFSFAAHDPHGEKTDSYLLYGTRGIRAGIIVEPEPPYAVDQPLTFTAITDLPEGEARFAWDFGDGTPAGAGEQVTHSYLQPTEPGLPYYVTLTVLERATNLRYGSAEVAIEVEGESVTGEAPTAVIETTPPTEDGAVFIGPGDSVRLDGSASSDPDSVDLVYEWEVDGIFVSSEVVFSHTFDEKKLYIVSLTVTDESGNQDTASVEVDARGTPSQIEAGFTTLPEPARGTGPFDVLFDARATRLPANTQSVRFDWDFGDGSTGTGEQATYTYNNPGVFDVMLTVTATIAFIDPVTQEEIVQTLQDTAFGVVAVLSPHSREIPPLGQCTLVQRVSLQQPAPAPQGYVFGLRAAYSDRAAVSNYEVESVEPNAVLSTKLAGESFSAQLKVKPQNFCIGPNGEHGRTGELVMPRVNMNWDFRAIQSDACDAANPDYIYCDPTQFAIALSKKLNRIHVTSQSGGSQDEIDRLTSFRAYLMQDSFSQDFQQDFVHHYLTQTFAEVPSFFSDPSTPWDKYFNSPDRLTFEPRALPGPGLYQVDLDFAWNAGTYEFFAGGQPDALITVNFQRIRPSGTQLPDSPFYYLPFNGRVGTTARSGETTATRQGYGIGYLNTGEPIILAFTGTTGSDTVDTLASGGTQTFTTAIEDEMTALNTRARGQVFQIDRSARTVTFSPSTAVPLLLVAEAHDNKAETYYLISEDLSPMNLGSGFAEWHGIGTSPQLACTDFHDRALPSALPDQRADAYDAVTCITDEKAQHALGFRWDPVTSAKNGERLVLASVVFLPLDRDLVISSACQESTSLVASPEGISSAGLTSDPVSLFAGGASLNSLDKIVELVREEKICVSGTATEATFFWNTEGLLADQDPNSDIQSAIGYLTGFYGGQAGGGINWDNYKCELGGVQG